MRIGQFRPEVLAAISQAPSVKRQVRAVAMEIRKEARRRCPKDTGALAKNIAIDNVYDPDTRRVEYHVGWTKRGGFYGPLVELGTEDTPPRPHLRPAADLIASRLAG
jgi:HK97 gp10 family phage protein